MALSLSNKEVAMPKRKKPSPEEISDYEKDISSVLNGGERNPSFERSVDVADSRMRLVRNATGGVWDQWEMLGELS